MNLTTLPESTTAKSTGSSTPRYFYDLIADEFFRMACGMAERPVNWEELAEQFAEKIEVDTGIDLHAQVLQAEAELRIPLLLLRYDREGWEWDEEWMELLREWGITGKDYKVRQANLASLKSRLKILQDQMEQGKEGAKEPNYDGYISTCVALSNYYQRSVNPREITILEYCINLKQCLKAAQKKQSKDGDE